jgi:hypothetical protein
MTWGEFKKQVEAAGIKDDTRIFYIDTGNFPDEDEIRVVMCNEGLVIGR